MSRSNIVVVSLSKIELVFVSDLLKSYRNLFYDSGFLDVDCSPGIKVLDSILGKFDNCL